MSVTQQRATHNDELRHSTLTALSGGAPRAARPTPILYPLSSVRTVLNKYRLELGFVLNAPDRETCLVGSTGLTGGCRATYFHYAKSGRPHMPSACV